MKSSPRNFILDAAPGKLTLMVTAAFLSWYAAITLAVIIGIITFLVGQRYNGPLIPRVISWIASPIYTFAATGLLVIVCLMSKNWEGLVLLIINLFWGDQFWRLVPLWIEKKRREK